ncbi:MAG: hypothetical protein R3E50_06045 [Halioglobus sp.]
MFDKSDPPGADFKIPVFHRNGHLDEEGVSQVFVERFVHDQLPFLLKVKAEMDAGKVLTDGELELMTRTVELAHNINAFVYMHPQLKELVAKVIDILHDITGEALRNATDLLPK